MALIQIDLRMNGYLFGCLLLSFFWLTTLAVLRFTRWREQIPEFWWASLACGALGFSEFLFVPEYWDPPSILKVGRWDLESFVFCFAVGGIAAVLAEFPAVKGFFVWAAFAVERFLRWTLKTVSKMTGGAFQPSLIQQVPMSRLIPPSQTRIENMLLVTFFLGMFGTTSQFGLNIIYDSAIVSGATGLFIAWRRPNLRWQVVGGGITFTIIYAVVLTVVAWVYPHFYEHWNLKALSGRWILGAPAEEYLFALTFGMCWAPLYEAWKATST